MKKLVIAAVLSLLPVFCACTPPAPVQSSIEESSVTKRSIPAVKITDCKIKLEELHADSGKEQPDVTISYQGKTLVEGTDYTVAPGELSQENGEGELIITMHGEFEGVQKVPYVISPKGTSLTACRAMVSSIDLQWEAAPDADGYEIEYSPIGEPQSAKTLRAEKDQTALSLTGLRENSSYRLRIRTVQITGGREVFSGWSESLRTALVPISTVNGVTYVDGILVVNKTYSLPADYGSGENREALDAFYRMQADAAREGLYLEIISGFRSFSTQAYTYQSFVYDRGSQEADRVSARPGHSEHQTGLAFDINTTSFAFAYTPEAEWLAANCARYGFIIRYPEGKEEQTGYQYESWHIRYVGQEKAERLTDSGLSIEEYYGLSSQYSE